MRVVHRGLLLVALFGCGRTAGQADPESCGPVSGSAPQERARVLAGEFRLRMVATQGKATGGSTAGTLRLMVRDAPDRMPGGAPDASFAFPLYGAASLDLAPVGAATLGDAGSVDSAKPGVLVMERLADSLATPGRVLLRLGADANAGGGRRIEGAYTVLRVSRLTPDEFAGSWASGTAAPEAGGYFCATRVP